MMAESSGVHRTIVHSTTSGMPGITSGGHTSLPKSVGGPQLSLPKKIGVVSVKVEPPSLNMAPNLHHDTQKPTRLVQLVAAAGATLGSGGQQESVPVSAAPNILKRSMGKPATTITLAPKR